MLAGLGVPPPFLPMGPCFRCPLPSAGFHRVWFPRFTGLTGHYDFLPAVPHRFVSLCLRGTTLRVRSFTLRVRRTQRLGARALVRRPPPPNINVETTGSPKFLGNPHGCVPCS
jgi:hypothetical protein